MTDLQNPTRARSLLFKGLALLLEELNSVTKLLPQKRNRGRNRICLHPAPLTGYIRLLGLLTAQPTTAAVCRELLPFAFPYSYPSLSPVPSRKFGHHGMSM